MSALSGDSALLDKPAVAHVGMYLGKGKRALLAIETIARPCGRDAHLVVVLSGRLPAAVRSHDHLGQRRAHDALEAHLKRVNGSGGVLLSTAHVLVAAVGRTLRGIRTSTAACCAAACTISGK